MHEEFGRLRIEQIMYLAVLCDLLEEQYGETFVAMCQSVQTDIVLVCSDVPPRVAIECLVKKFETPTVSLKELLIAGMQQSQKDL